jgi:hypothetical protein
MGWVRPVIADDEGTSSAARRRPGGLAGTLVLTGPGRGLEAPGRCQPNVAAGSAQLDEAGRRWRGEFDMQGHTGESRIDPARDAR